MPQSDRIDFLYIGGHKCGSTWLFDMMIQHPQISPCALKEPNFFNMNFDKGYSYYYSLWKSPGLKGEFSQSYFTSRKALERIHEHNPDVKLIVSLRNPYDRMISNFIHWNRRNKIENVDFNQYVQDTPAVINRSLYGKNLKNVFELFKKENILILFFEDIASRPLSLLKDVYTFLQINAGFVAKNYQKKVGKGFIPRYRLLEVLRNHVFNYLSAGGMSRTVYLLRSLGLGRFYRMINAKEKSGIQINVSSQYSDMLLNDLSQLKQLFSANGLDSHNQYVDSWISWIEKKTGAETVLN